MVRLVLAAVAAVEPRRMAVVTGPTDEDLTKELGDLVANVTQVPVNVRFDPCAAVLTALGEWMHDDLDLDLDPDDDDVLVVPASVPLLTGDTLRSFYRSHRASDAAGSVLVGPGAEARHSSIWFVRRSLLAPALRRTESADLAAIGDVLLETGHDINTVEVDDPNEITEIQDRADLAGQEALLRARINMAWMRRGVTMIDPSRTYVDAEVALEPDVVLHPGVQLQGSTQIGAGSEIGAGSRLCDTKVGVQCRLDRTTAELATIGDHARVGPFAVLEPGSDVPGATVTGPFYAAGPDAH